MLDLALVFEQFLPQFLRLFFILHALVLKQFLPQFLRLSFWLYTLGPALVFAVFLLQFLMLSFWQSMQRSYSCLCRVSSSVSKARFRALLVLSFTSLVPSPSYTKREKGSGLKGRTSAFSRNAIIGNSGVR